MVLWMVSEVIAARSNAIPTLLNNRFRYENSEKMRLNLRQRTPIKANDKTMSQLLYQYV